MKLEDQRNYKQPFLFHPKGCRNQYYEGHIRCDRAREALYQEFD